MLRTKIRKIILSCVILGCMAADALAQNPIVVQTLTYDSISTRRAQWVFPDATKRYRKVIMEYRLKCDPATTQDGFDCGEWDYLTYNNVWVHTGLMDSNLIERDRFLFNDQAVDTAKYSTNPAYEYRQQWQYLRVIDTVRSQSQHQLANSVYANANPLNLSERMAVSQMLWTPGELTASGLTAGDIHLLGADFDVLGGPVQKMKVRMRQTADSAHANWISAGWTEVFYSDLLVPGKGWQDIPLTTPFTWDGTSSIQVEISFRNNAAGIDHQLMGDSTSTPTHYIAGADGYIEVANGEFIDIPMNGVDLGDEITVSFWAYGDAGLLPRNTSVFEARDSIGQRVLNFHGPWSNGRVYWDAGAGSGYDRIDRASSKNDYTGKWVHWALTKNAATGQMQVFRNGVSYMAGTGKTMSLGKIDRFLLGKSINGNYRWAGKIDEFSVWDKVLADTSIAALMNGPVTTSHPDYPDLLVHYDFNSHLQANDLSANQREGILTVAPDFKWYEGDDINGKRYFSTTVFRPDVRFTQGDYATHLDSTLVTDTVLASPGGMIIYGLNGKSFGIDSIYQVWPSGYYYTYGPDGSVVDSMMLAANGTQYNSSLSYYEEPFEIVDRYEIGRFITPYGIGLDLGPDGFMWKYDVTDYQWLLHDTVDFSAGNQQELIDVKFLMYEGIPPRDVVEMNRPWGQRGSKRYRDLDNDVQLSADTIQINPGASEFMLKTRFTGHGHNSNDGSYPHCCEWKDNTHYVYANGVEIDAWKIWQTNQCADNPVWPQGGTWPAAREGWCPADVVADHNVELTQHVNGSDVILDYDITPVPAGNQGMGNGNYQVAMHFFQYGAANHQYDVEVMDILSPNAWEYRSRHNPVCKDPQIVIRNTGKQTLQSLDIYYGVSDTTFNHRLFEWTGSLRFMESEVVTLPIDQASFWSLDSDGKFYAEVRNPNGQTDEYAVNDRMEVDFQLPVQLSGNNFILDYRTNNVPEDNAYVLWDINGNIISERHTHTSSTTYRDSLELPDGCYTLEFLDTSQTGLYYWAWSAQGAGYLRFRDSANQIIEDFEPEFGRRVFYTFWVGEIPKASAPAVGIDAPGTEVRFDLYPNPTDGFVQLKLDGLLGEYQLRIRDLQGRVMRNERLLLEGEMHKRMDLNSLGAGVYFVELSRGDERHSRKLILTQ